MRSPAPLLPVLAAVAALPACSPRPARAPELPSLDAKSPAGTPDTRLALLEDAKREADRTARAGRLAAIARDAPPADALARQARVALIRTYAEDGNLAAMHRTAGELEIRDDSEGADLLNVMAYAYAEAGVELDRALRYSRRALEVVASLRRPGSVPADAWKRHLALVVAAYKDTLGWVLFKGGDAKGAARQLVQAAEILPDDPSVNLHLGHAWIAAGKPGEAVGALVRAAVAGGPEGPVARTLAFDAAAKAGIAGADVEARLSEARRSLETRVRAAAIARKLDEGPRELTAMDPSGTPVRIQPSGGRPTVLLFWGAFSAPSLRLLKVVPGAIDATTARLLTVSLDRNVERATAAASEAGLPPPGLDLRGEDAEAFQVRGLPTVLVLDAHGRVRYRNEGIVPGYEVQLQAQLESLQRGEP